LKKDLDYDIAGKHILIVEDSSVRADDRVPAQNSRRGAPPACDLHAVLSPDEQLIGIPISYVGFEVSKARLWGRGWTCREGPKSTALSRKYNSWCTPSLLNR
jgi:hypoxanthine-guanine phosphoribosyltransferase